MRWPSIFVSMVFLLVLAGSTATVLDRTEKRPFNVVLLTVESWRADRVTPALAPNLFAAARHGTIYTHHRSIAAWTAPNIIALLSGLSPFEQGVHARGQSVAADRDLPLEKLARAGWEIGSVQAFARTENFLNLGMPVAGGETPEGWIARHRLDGKPFFFWHHYLDTHLPYNSPKSFLAPGSRLPKRGDPAFARIEAVRKLPAVRANSVAFEASDQPYIDALYNGDIREFDVWFKRFWNFFNAAGLREDTLLVVTADHGEELLERGHVGHASTTTAGTLYEETVHVPLFIWWPKRLGLPEGKVVDTPNDHLDVMPTILGVLDQPYGVSLPGRSLLRDRKDYRWYALTSKGGFAEPDPDNIHNYIAAVADERWKLVAWLDRRAVVATRLYDLQSDPGERRDVAAENPDVMARLLPPLLERIAHFVLPATPAAAADREGKPEGAGPRWVFPVGSCTVTWNDLQGRAYLEWTGAPDKSYALEYQAGSGAMRVAGLFSVDGPEKDFGTFSRKYWQTWVVPYKQVTVRVREEPDGAWSVPITIKLAE